MSINPEYVEIMNKSIRNLIKKALVVSIQKPIVGKSMIQLASGQKQSERKRKVLIEEGYHIPPFLISSITNRCNLMCKGCYAHATKKVNTTELSDDQWFDIFSQASDAGVSFILIAGGEPFIRPGVLKKAALVKDIIFPIFTNGTYLGEEALSLIDDNRNLIPIISIEGYKKDTDQRRGNGIYERTLQNMKTLKSKHILFGTSITLTRENYDIVTQDEFINTFTKEGCSIFFYVEYVPLDNNTKDLEITQEQRENLKHILSQHRLNHNAMFLSFPGDEEKFGGCLSSGRGFAHINASGDLEPCPFAPYSDVNLKTHSLKDALQSKFLTSIRESDESLKETEHGCALFNNNDWLQSLLG